MSIFRNVTEEKKIELFNLSEQQKHESAIKILKKYKKLIIKI